MKTHVQPGRKLVKLQPWFGEKNISLCEYLKTKAYVNDYVNIISNDCENKKYPV